MTTRMALLVLLLTPSLGARPIESPFTEIAGNSIAGSRTVRFDHTAYDLLQRSSSSSEPILLHRFVLPGVAPIDLQLRPIKVMKAGARAVAMTAHGPVPITPSVVLFSGHVPGRRSAAFLAISPTQLNGFVNLDGELFILSSGGATQNGTARITAASALNRQPADGWCSVVSRPAPSPRTGLAALPVVRSIDLFVECDELFRSLFSTAQQAADYALTLYAAQSELLRRDTGLIINIPDGYLRVWEFTPPWGSGNPNLAGLSDLQRYWNDATANPNHSLPRTMVTLLTSYFVGGAAFFRTACINNLAYLAMGCNGHFPYPLVHQHNDNWDIYVGAHETAHVLGARHTFEMNPPVPCVDGSGPDGGTLMSYCYQNAGGVLNIGLRFHPRVQTRIRGFMASATCTTEIAYQPGDYDFNGIHQLTDLAALDAYLGQGFASAGAKECFDIDGSGTVDAVDRSLLVDLIEQDTAAATLRNGSGVNPLAFQPLGDPVLGGLWTAQIDLAGGMNATKGAIFFFPAPSAGSFIAAGELLVDINTPMLLLDVEPKNPFFGVSYHTLLVPNDPGLLGAMVFSQGVILGPGNVVISLTNAVDLRLGY